MIILYTLNFNVMKKLTRPEKPIKPNIRDYPLPKEPNGKNFLNEPIYQRLDYVEAYKKFQKEMDKWVDDMEIYEQLKFIRLIKNAKEDYCLKKLKITKRL